MRVGGSIRALSDIFEFTGITDHDWRAMECTRVNGRATEAQFKRTCPGDPEYGSWVKSREPEVIIENTFRRANELEEGQQGTTGAATNIVHTFISSQAHLLILESTPYLLKSAYWMGDLSPLLSTTGCCWEAVELSAQQVGIPSTHGHKTRGATVDDSFPSDNTTKGTYRGPLGPVLDGVHLGRLGIEGINNNDALPLTA